MSKNEHRDTTTDFFLKVISKEKSEQEESQIPSRSFEIDSKSEKIINGFLSVMNFINSTLDKMLQSNMAIKILSFVLSIILLFTVSGGSLENILSTPNSGDYIKNVEVEVDNLNEEYVVSGIPETVSVGLVGPSIDIYNAKLSKEYRIYADLVGLVEGEHVIELKQSGFSDALNVLINPQSVNVTISKKVTKTFKLTHRFINEDKLNEDYSISVNNVEHKEVEVRGSQDNIDKVYSVEALIDVAEVESSFTQDCEIKAYDRSGKELEVDIIPATVKVDCELSTYSKEVPLAAQYVGNIASGYIVERVDFSSNEVKIFGDEEKIKDITELSVKIDVTGLQDKKEFKGLKIIKLSDINNISIDKVDATVYVVPSVSRQFANIPIVINNKEGKSVILNRKDIMITIYGPSDKVNNLKESDICAYIDARTLKKGNQKVDVLVDISDKSLTYTIDSNAKVNATLK